MIDRDRIEKLPKWAQRYISKLELDVEYVKKQLHQVEFGDTPIAWRSFKEQHGIPESAWVEFELPDGKIELSITEEGNKSLYVRVPIGYPEILPCSGNAFYVSVRRKR